MGGLRRQLIVRALITLLASAVLAPAPLLAQVRFEASPVAPPDSEGRVVWLRLVNAGKGAARDVFVEALLGARRAELELGPFAAGEARSFRLDFPGSLPRPGRHALALQIEYKPDTPQDAAARTQPALLLLELGASPLPALSLSVEPRPLDVAGSVALALQSLDGAPHRASLGLLLPTGVNVLDAPTEVEVPAAGVARVEARLVRGDAARGSRQPLTAFAVPKDGPLERAAVAHAELEIAPDPAWLPRLRPLLVGLGAGLLALALALELRGRKSRA